MTDDSREQRLAVRGFSLRVRRRTRRVGVRVPNNEFVAVIGRRSTVIEL